MTGEEIADRMRLIYDEKWKAEKAARESFDAQMHTLMCQCPHEYCKDEYRSMMDTLQVQYKCKFCGKIEPWDEHYKRCPPQPSKTGITLATKGSHDQH